MESLNDLAAYCEDTVAHRRVLMLRHFGEAFDSADSAGSCDNWRTSHRMCITNGVLVDHKKGNILDTGSFPVGSHATETGQPKRKSV